MKTEISLYITFRTISQQFQKETRNSNKQRRMRARILPVLNLSVTSESPYILWYTRDRDTVLAATLQHNKLAIAALRWDRARCACDTRRVKLTFDIVKDLVELLLFSDEWRSKLTSRKHTELADSIIRKLNQLILYWKRNDYDRGWLSELL